MILIGLGANLPSRHGTPPQTLEAALKVIDGRGIRIAARSRIWVTAPVPVSDQPWYHNAVAAVDTTMSAPDLLACLHDIENAFGRVREIRNEPRVLDLDLLCYNDLVSTAQDLTIPHPRLHERAFVLMPLQDIAPGWIHPGLGANLTDMLAHIPPEQAARPMEDR